MYKTHKLAAELSIPIDPTSGEIFSLIKQYLIECQQELPKRHIDIVMFDAMGPYVDWKRLYSDHLQRLR